MRVLGVDPGLTVTGYAVIDLRDAGPELVEAGAIRAGSRHDLPLRLRAIYRDLTEILEEFRPEVVGLETAFSAGRFPRAAIQMAHARGVVCLAVGEMNTRLVDITPREVKSAIVGNGAASKEQVQASIQTHFRLDAPPEPNDVADALAIATAVAYRCRRERLAALR